MNTILIFLNAMFTIGSLIWLVTHSTKAVFDQEWWMAFAYFTICGLNLLNGTRKDRRIPD